MVDRTTVTNRRRKELSSIINIFTIEQRIKDLAIQYQKPLQNKKSFTNKISINSDTIVPKKI